MITDATGCRSTCSIAARSSSIMSNVITFWGGRFSRKCACAPRTLARLFLNSLIF